jgi:hypothetical protein
MRMWTEEGHKWTGCYREYKWWSKGGLRSTVIEKQEEPIRWYERVLRGWNSKELLRNKLRLTWGWAEVLPVAPLVHILNRWAWTGLWSLSPLCVSLVIANKWDEAFFWPIAFSHLCGDTQTRLRLHKGAWPIVSLRSQDLRLNTRTQYGKKFHYCTIPCSAAQCSTMDKLSLGSLIRVDCPSPCLVALHL